MLAADIISHRLHGGHISDTLWSVSLWRRSLSPLSTLGHSKHIRPKLAGHFTHQFRGAVLRALHQLNQTHRHQNSGGNRHVTGIHGRGLNRRLGLVQKLLHSLLDTCIDIWIVGLIAHALQTIHNCICDSTHFNLLAKIRRPLKPEPRHFGTEISASINADFKCHKRRRTAFIG